MLNIVPRTIAYCLWKIWKRDWTDTSQAWEPRLDENKNGAPTSVSLVTATSFRSESSKSILFHSRHTCGREQMLRTHSRTTMLFEKWSQTTRKPEWNMKWHRRRNWIFQPPRRLETAVKKDSTPLRHCKQLIGLWQLRMCSLRRCIPKIRLRLLVRCDWSTRCERFAARIENVNETNCNSFSAEDRPPALAARVGGSLHSAVYWIKDTERWCTQFPAWIFKGQGVFATPILGHHR